MYLSFDTLCGCCATLEIYDFPYDTQEDKFTEQEVLDAINDAIDKGTDEYENVNCIIATVRVDEQEIAAKALVKAGFKVAASFLNRTDKPVLLFTKNLKHEPAPEWAVPAKKVVPKKKPSKKGRK